MGEGVTELNDITKLKIKSKNLDKAIKKIELKSIKKAFPDFNEADTIKIGKDGKKIKLFNMSRIFNLKLKNKDDIGTTIEILLNENGVLFAEQNYYDYHSYGFPNDEHYENGDQWGLNNYGQDGGKFDADIDAPEAWQITTGTNVLVGVIDDGVDAVHEDLLGKVSGDAGVYAGNVSWAFGHGTHVAGIIAGIGNNTVGIAGVNWAANINSQRIENGSSTDIYNAIIASVNAGSEVLNNSWGGYTYSRTIRMAFANAYKLNVVSVTSMGNDNTSSISYPAGYGQGILSVGATDRDDLRSLWLNGQGSNYGNHIDVVAPGTSIWSSLPYTNGYESWNGTSMAAPFVSGLASLLKGYNTNLENDDIENIIRLSADDLFTTGWDQYYGTGRVNAKKALDYLRAPYTLSHLTASGGTVYSSTAYYSTVILGATGLTDGEYFVKKHNVRKDVSWTGMSYPNVWGRGVVTTGWADDPIYSMPWCDVVGSPDRYSATLETNVYEVWEPLFVSTIGIWVPGELLGWFPSTPSNVVYAYTLLGQNDGVESENLLLDEDLNSTLLKKNGIIGNYPNPFNPSTKISYQIPENSFVSLVVYNTLGQKVAELVNEHQSSGKYSVQFNATNLPSGVYIYKIQAGEFSSVKKMLLTK